MVRCAVYVYHAVNSAHINSPVRFVAAQVPAVLFLTTYWRDDLIGLYWGMVVGYFVVCVLYSAIAFTSDWEKYARIAFQRSESTGTGAAA